MEGNFNFLLFIFLFFFFPPSPSNFETQFFDVLHKRTVFVFFSTPLLSLVLDRILFDINQALKHLWAWHLLSIKMYLDYAEKFSFCWKERQVKPRARKLCLTRPLRFTFVSIVPPTFDTVRWNHVETVFIIYPSISLEKYGGWKESHRKGKYWETNWSGRKMDIYFFTPLKFSTGPYNIHTPRIATLVPLERESARSW